MCYKCKWAGQSEQKKHNCTVCTEEYYDHSDYDEYCNDCVDIKRNYPMLFKWVERIIRNRFYPHLKG